MGLNPTQAIILTKKEKTVQGMLYIFPAFIMQKSSKNVKKSNKFASQFSKKTGFLSLHQNAGRVF